ncbi:MAG: SpoIID/LytB domain-containing protein [Armatimonadota bacterium]|nr:SpoIID/LytB domain-containing protein [Armatimonadota bacterium]MDR7404068.1 SpoIID/LytB domain-containing protein [Armatimonadota bacterium]
MTARPALHAAALAAALALAAGSAPAAQGQTPAVIRVGLLREQERVVVLSDRPITLTARTAVSVRLDPGAYEAAATPSGVDIAGVGRWEGPVRLVPADGALLYLGIRPYRGILELRPSGGRLVVVNEVPLEEYLYGVLPVEVDPRWPEEALKAQAVAARTLAVYSLNRYAAEGYDVRATTDTQVYGGAGVEDPRTSLAVDATRGEIVTYQGRPIFAAFHSDSGGHTESSEHVWGGRYPYLRGVPDPYSAGAPTQQWVVVLDSATLEARLRQAGFPVAGITEVLVAELTPSGRAATVRVQGAHGTLVIRGTDLRAAVGVGVLRSTLFAVRGGEGAWEFAGRGSGHGVGLSQWGARGLAAAGRTYREILRYYYTGVEVEGR